MFPVHIEVEAPQEADKGGALGAAGLGPRHHFIGTLARLVGEIRAKVEQTDG